MLKRLLSLISAAALLLPLTAAAFDFPGRPENLQTTGFIYFTHFSDRDWFEGRQVAAINVDYDINNFAIRSQLSTYQEQPLRRFVLEYSTPVVSNVEAVAQVGRFSVIESVFNDVTSSPAAFQMAMLPQSGYSYRMFNGSFSIMDGWQIGTSWRNGDWLVKARYGEGKAVVPSETDLIHEAFKRDFSGNDAISMTALPKSSVFGMQVETNNFVGYLSRNVYKHSVSQIGTSRLATLAATVYSEISYRVDRVGGKYDNGDWWIHQEWVQDYTHAFNKHPSVNKWAKVNNSVGDVTILGYHINDNWAAYLGRSHGRNKMSPTHNVDEFVGATWNSHPFTVSVEVHKGEGFAWRKYDAPMTAVYPDYPKWNSIVISGTYVF